VKLDGTYKGVFYDGKDSDGQNGTLKITGSKFDLVLPSGTRSGIITAPKTCGYTAFSLRFFDESKYGTTVSVSAHKIGSMRGYEISTLEAIDRPIVLQTLDNEKMDFAFVICPETYPECWPYRRRCPCERP